MIGAVKEERDKRSEKVMVAPKVKRPVRHVMWYELKDKYLPDHWKRNRDYRNEMEDTVLCQSTSHETRLETLPIKEELIETLGLSVRSENCLHRAGIETIGKLSDTTAADLKRIRNLGKKCLDEIIEKLAEKELTLREEETEGEIVSFVE
jgi:DNA-directed RNA polymerase subunit alpha